MHNQSNNLPGALGQLFELSERYSKSISTALRPSHLTTTTAAAIKPQSQHFSTATTFLDPLSSYQPVVAAFGTSPVVNSGLSLLPGSTFSLRQASNTELSQVYPTIPTPNTYNYGINDINESSPYSYFGSNFQGS